ncbi:ribosomal RNA-processing protein 7-domain-containing protein [Lipomyces oligophaga]|uniref:ribosomal RNA-processing protein 7-domain-containing protein n=1 Tax=Lipomyces oligophaga TaxID=45792 RepID=UPI0034CE8271
MTSEQLNSKAKTSNETINGYFTIAVNLSASSSADQVLEVDAIHYIFARRHESSENSDVHPAIFFCNLPINCSTMHIFCLIKTLNPKINKDSISVTFFPSPAAKKMSSFIPSSSNLLLNDSQKGSQILRVLPVCSSALVSFSSSHSLKPLLSGLQAHSLESPISWSLPAHEAVSGTSGLRRYQAIYRRRHVSPYVLQASVDFFMENFAKIELQQEKAARQAFSEPDADGFITVSRAANSRQVVAASSDSIREVALKKQERKQLSNFYRFQQREQKKAKMNDLLKRFKSDQEKIAELKHKRKFNPFSNPHL